MLAATDEVVVRTFMAALYSTVAFEGDPAGTMPSAAPFFTSFAASPSICSRHLKARPSSDGILAKLDDVVISSLAAVSKPQMNASVTAVAS